MAKLQIFAEGDGDGGVHANGDGVENGKSGDKNQIGRASCRERV